MKVGDLVRFKHPEYRTMYGVGLLLEKNQSKRLGMPYGYWALFNDEKILVRLDELELTNETW